jgi:chromosome segregation ATPase
MPEATPGQGTGETRTSIDALVELLRAKGKTELNALAVDLGADPKIVERWGKVLESGGMAKISYEVGRMYLEPITMGREELQSVKARLDAKGDIVKQDMNVQRAELDKFAEHLTAMSMDVTEIENVYRQRMPEVQQMLAEITKSYMLVESEQKNVIEIRNSVEATYSEVNRRINELSSKAESLSAAGNDKSMAANTERVNELLKRANAASSEVEELRKAKDRFLEGLKKSAEAQLEEFGRQLDAKGKELEARLDAESRQIQQIGGAMKEQINTAKSFEDQINEFRRHGESARRTLNRARIEFSDKYQKLSESMYRNSKLVESNSKGLIEKINVLKAAFGDVAKLDEMIKELRTEVDDISKQIVEERAETTEVLEALKALGESANLPLEQKASVVDQLSTKDSSVKAKMTKIKKAIDESDKKLKGQGGKSGKV